MTNAPKTVLAIHDLPGFGRAALSVIVPVLSCLGVQAVALPTAVLSAHTQYPTYSFLDLTDEMKRIIGNWEKMNVHFDTFYTG